MLEYSANMSGAFSFPFFFTMIIVIISMLGKEIFVQSSDSENECAAFNEQVSKQ